MLDAVVAVVAGLLVIAGVLVLVGPNLRSMARRAIAVRRPGGFPFGPRQDVRRAAAPAAVNPNTQRVLVASGRLASWLRAHGHDDLARELRGAASRLAGNEAAGLYALQTALRRLRVVSTGDTASEQRLAALANELRDALRDRFEQLELLPFRRP